MRIARRKELIKENSKEMDFYNFKKFMADKFLGLTRDKAHEKGFRLGGDVGYQFSLSDMYGNPNAFAYDVYMAQPNMKIPALNFYQITDPKSSAAKLIKQKIRLAAERYDTLRLDVGWGYMTPMLSNTSETYFEQKPMGNSVVKIIENTVKEVKGDEFNPKDIFYEVEAGADDFKAFKEDGSLIEPMQRRMKIYSSNYMNEGWGHNKAYLEKFNFSPTEFIYGASNRDTTPLIELASEPHHAKRKADQIKVLSKIFKIEPSTLEKPDEFIRAKNAEPLTAKNHFMFFAELFGLERKFNSHDDNGFANFRPKIPANPEQAYYDAAKDGRAFNIMDGLEKIFKAQGLDEKHPELYKEIIKFKNKLNGIEPGIIEEVIQSTVETEEKTKVVAKGNRFLKPLLAAAGVVIILFTAYEIYSKNRGKTKSF